MAVKLIFCWVPCGLKERSFKLPDASWLLESLSPVIKQTAASLCPNENDSTEDGLDASASKSKTVLMLRWLSCLKDLELLFISVSNTYDTELQFSYIMIKMDAVICFLHGERLQILDTFPVLGILPF